MVVPVPDILARIVSEKRRELPAVLDQLTTLERQVEERRPGRRDFRQALLTSPPAVIAEIKKASPSKGLLSSDFRPTQLAHDYAAGGAAALSVLTDQQFFQGSLTDLEDVRSTVRLPLLRKDFTMDRAHIVQAAAHGADAVLLIVAVLSVTELRDFREFAAQFGLAALVEVHDQSELDAALDSGADIIGVNNRNLHTFSVDLEISLRLADKLPNRTVRVSESGIETAAQVQRLQHAGYHAFLVGEHLVRSGAPAAAIQALRG